MCPNLLTENPSALGWPKVFPVDRLNSKNWQHLLDTAFDAIIATDAQKTIFYANEPAQKLFGYSLNEITGKNLSLLIPAVGLAGDLEAGPMPLLTGTRSNGAEFPLEGVVADTRSDSGVVYSLALRDATANREAATLKQDHSRLEVMFSRFVDAIPGGFAVFYFTAPDQAQCIYASAGIYEVFGARPAELMQDARIPMQRMNPDDRERAFAVMQSDFSGDGPLPYFEHRLMHPERGEIWIELRRNRERFSDGTVKIFMHVIDITERKKLELELDRFMTLSPHLLYAARITETALVPIWRSPNISKILGYTEKDMAAPNWWMDKVHASDRERVIAAKTPPFYSDEQVLEYRFLHKSGNYVWLRDEQRLVKDASGAGIEVVGGISDVTNRVQLEGQMRQSQKMEAIGQLAAGVAHDFNNLLTVITGNADLALLEGRGRENVPEYLQEIREAAAQGAELTKQLLYLGRKQPMNMQEIDLSEAVEKGLKVLRRTLGTDIDLRYKSLGKFEIIADEAMVLQILLNLAVNARDAMPSGGRLEIATEEIPIDAQKAALIPYAKPGRFACLVFSDNGMGIPQDIVGRIFEPFFTTKEVGKGTGLGLATVFGIVQQHGGWINVYSEPGSGTTFRIYFPVHGKSRLQVKQETQEESVVRRGTETILIVEDQPSLRRMAVLVLSRLGYNLIEAGTAVEALRIWEARSNEISLVLTDIVMPEGMSGFELGARLKAEKPDIKIIYSSGFSGELLNRGKPLNESVEFLQKPYAANDLVAIVSRNFHSVGQVPG